MRRLFILALAFMAVSTAQAKVTVEKISYRGWPGSYRLTAGDYSLVVVPEIGGRIMEYSLEGINFLWENESEYGMTYPIKKEWHNFGGYKTWVSPEEYWGWPPDFMLDCGKANVEVLQTAKGLPMLRVIGAPSLSAGLFFSKEITLTESGEIQIKQRMHNIGPKTVQYGIWDVTQVKTPCFVAFPINPDSRFPDGLHYKIAESRNSTQFNFNEGYCITTYKGEPGDICSDSNGPWMLGFRDDLAFVKYFGPMEKDAEYPDGGCSCEVFTSDPKLGYVEMEILGPMIKMPPGGQIELEGRWKLIKLTQSVTNEDRVLKAIKGMRGKGWIP